MNHPAQSQDSICSGRLQRSRIYKAQNSSSIDPGYNISTIILEKAKSYPVNQNRVSQMSNASNMMLSRESMHLTPQFQSPDVWINSHRTTHRVKQNPTKPKQPMPVSRNHRNTLNRHKMSSREGSQTFINSFISSNKSQSHILMKEEPSSRHPLNTIFASHKQKWKKSHVQVRGLI